MTKVSYRAVDVKGDGSCFFRSLFVAAKHKRIAGRILKHLGGNREAAKDEDAFVLEVRVAIARMIEQHEDNGLVSDVYQNLKSVNAASYKFMARSTFPQWFMRAFPSIPSSERQFRERLSEEIRKMSSWAGEIEYRLLRDVLKKKLKMHLIVLNSSPRTMKVFKKNALYLINRGEAHYNALLVDFVDEGSAKKEKKEKRCTAQQVYNPVTRRCVSRDSCTGYKVIADRVREMGLQVAGARRNV